MTKHSTLLIGAGELGDAIITALLSHPTYSLTSTPLTLMLRPTTIINPSPDRRPQITRYKSLNITLLPGDQESDTLTQLTNKFRPFTTVIHAAGMTASPGTQTKITQAVLAAGVKLYVPWQFGVDYDLIGPRGGFGLFEEQFNIRQLLRSQEATKWVIVSNGIFMSFIFEEFWGVVTKTDNEGEIRVRALNSWDDWITVTTAEDIGRATAELVLNEDEVRNQAVYIAGETLTYKQFADVVEEESGKRVVREVWPLDYLKEEARRDPETKLRKYHVVFSEGKGLSWPKEKTWNVDRGMEMEGVREWMRRCWK